MIRRRRWSLWAGILYAVILASVAIGLGRLYTASRDRLDEALAPLDTSNPDDTPTMPDFNTPAATTYSGTEGDDYLVGGADNDRLIGSYFDDVLDSEPIGAQLRLVDVDLVLGDQDLE